MRTLSVWIRRLHKGVAALVLGQRILQAWARRYLVRKLNESPDLSADVGDVELHFLQGIAVVRDVHLIKLSEGQRVAEVRCRKISVRVQWRALIGGAFVGSATVLRPRVILFAEREKDAATTLLNDPVLALRREMLRLMPFHLCSIEVTEGGIDYISQFTSPAFEMRVDNVSLSATHLTNIPSLPAACRVFVEGQTMGQGTFWIRLALPSLTEPLTFDLQAAVKHVNLVGLNDVLRASAGFDLKRGVCSIYSEFKVENGRYEGYIQPRFQNLDIFAWEKEHGKNLFQICRQAVVAFLAGLFKNQPRDELSMNIPISGTFDDADIDVWSAVGSLLRNTFVRSLMPSPRVNSGATEKNASWAWPGFWRRRRLSHAQS
jgi:hypothetical protein